MSLRVVSELPSDLLPVVCTCQSCKKKIEASEYSDFTHGPLFSGMDAEQSDEIYITCPICGKYAFPEAAVKEKLISAYELWKHLDPQSHVKIWSKPIKCPECKEISVIKIEDVKVLNTAVGYAGETWEPELNIKCPICKSYFLAKNRVPQGILNTVLSEAEQKRRR